MLYQALTSAPQIDAAYVSFEDGYHRVVTRIDDDRRRSDPKIPPTANWHSSYIDGFSAASRGGSGIARSSTLGRTSSAVYESRRHRISEPCRATRRRRNCTRTDRRGAFDQSGYRLSGHLRQISDHQRRRVHRLRLRQHHARCAVAVSRQPSRQLRTARRSSRIRPTARSSLIPTRKKAFDWRTAGWKSRKLDNIADDDVREAYRLQARRTGQFLFPLAATGEEMSASFTRFPESFGQAVGGHHLDADRRLHRHPQGERTGRWSSSSSR